jgi:hypothetical protein
VEVLAATSRTLMNIAAKTEETVRNVSAVISDTPQENGATTAPMKSL